MKRNLEETKTLLKKKTILENTFVVHLERRSIPILLVHFKSQTLQNFQQQIRVGTATLSDSLKNPPAEF